MILIVGVTGVLGRETARQLLAAGHKVRGMTRRPESATDLQKLGVEIVQGDLIDKPSLVRACAGVDSVLASAHSMMGTGKYKSDAVDDAGHRMLIDAAKAAGVKRFVYVSMQGVTLNHTVDFIRNKAKAEAYLQSSGLSYTILRPPAFMEWHVHNLLGKSILETGKVTIFGEGNNPTNFMAGKDIAHIAVLALTDPQLSGRILEMGGPDNLTKNQVAEMYGRFAGKTPKIAHVLPVMMRIMAPIVKPVNPVISRLMTASLWSDSTDQTFNPAPMLKEFPMRLTHVDEFIRERVKN